MEYAPSRVGRNPAHRIVRCGSRGLFDRNLLRGNVAPTMRWRRAVLAPLIVDRRPRPNFPWMQPKRRLIETQVRLEFVYIPNVLWICSGGRRPVGGWALKVMCETPAMGLPPHAHPYRHIPGLETRTWVATLVPERRAPAG